MERAGGLPSYIERIATHLLDKGMPMSQAIAVSINATKRMCSTGDLNFPGSQHVNPGSQAEACTAVAEWEALKARNKASHGLSNTSPTLLETAVTLGIARPDTLALAAKPKTPLTPAQQAAKDQRAAAKQRKMDREQQAQANTGTSASTTSTRSTSGGSGRFTEALHPRVAAGGPGGGRFAAGSARNSEAQKAQDNPGAQKNYGALQDAKDPAAAKSMLDGLSDTDLQDLSRAAYSFKSSDPTVVAQRIAIANALARRKMNVNDYGGLGKGTTKSATATTAITTKPSTPTVRKPGTGGNIGSHPEAKPKAAKLSHDDIARLELAGNMAGRAQQAAVGEAMPDGSFPAHDWPSLRKAIKAHGRAAPDKRDAVKAHLVKRARALGAEHLLPANWM